MDDIQMFVVKLEQKHFQYHHVPPKYVWSWECFYLMLMLAIIHLNFLTASLQNDTSINMNPGAPCFYVNIPFWPPSCRTRKYMSNAFYAHRAARRRPAWWRQPLVIIPRIETHHCLCGATDGTKADADEARTKREAMERSFMVLV